MFEVVLTRGFVK